jgi:hypothetical protein
MNMLWTKTGFIHERSSQGRAMYRRVSRVAVSLCGEACASLRLPCVHEMCATTRDCIPRQSKEAETARVPLGRRGTSEDGAAWMRHLAHPAARWAGAPARAAAPSFPLALRGHGRPGMDAACPCAGKPWPLTRM